MYCMVISLRKEVKGMAQNKTGQDMNDDTRTGMQDTPEQGEKGGQPTREEYGYEEGDPMADMDNDF